MFFVCTPEKATEIYDEVVEVLKKHEIEHLPLLSQFQLYDMLKNIATENFNKMAREQK
jgi:L-rhamnose mutarotase